MPKLPNTHRAHAIFTFEHQTVNVGRMLVRVEDGQEPKEVVKDRITREYPGHTDFWCRTRSIAEGEPKFPKVKLVLNRVTMRLQATYKDGVVRVNCMTSRAAVSGDLGAAEGTLLEAVRHRLRRNTLGSLAALLKVKADKADNKDEFIDSILVHT